MIVQQLNTQAWIRYLDISQVKDCLKYIWIDFTYKTRENTAKLTGYTFEEYRCPAEHLLIREEQWTEFDLNNWDRMGWHCWRPDPDVMPR